MRNIDDERRQSLWLDTLGSTGIVLLLVLEAIGFMAAFGGYHL